MPAGIAIRVGLVWLLAGAPAVLAEQHVAEPGREPVGVVERLHAAMLDAMKRAEELGFDGRARRLLPVVQETFDLPFMARFVVGGGWRKFTPQERERWQALFTEYMVANYAGQIRAWSGETFETLGTEPAPRGTVLVRTRLVPGSGEPIELTYRLRRSSADDGDWKIIDVYLKGTVSELALRRSDCTAVLEQSGFGGLVERIRGKIADLAAGRGSSFGTRQG